MPTPVHLAFLGCGFITRVHSRHLRALRGDVVWSYASRNIKKAADFCGRYGGTESYGDYRAAINDPRVDAVVIAVPPRFHLDLALAALDVARERELAVPADLSIISFDDTPIVHFAVPTLTAIDQPIAATASRAVELIIDAQRGTDLPDEPVVIPAALVKRQSTGPAPNSTPR